MTKKHLRIFCTLLLLLSCTFPAYSASLKFKWSPIYNYGIIGYRLYVGNYTRTYDRYEEILARRLSEYPEYTMTGLSERETYFFSLTSFNKEGESDYSEEIWKYIPGNQTSSIENSTAKDLIFCFECSIAKSTEKSEFCTSCDVNLDGLITSKDALCILK